MNAVQTLPENNRSEMLRAVLEKERADILARLHVSQPTRDDDGVSGDEMDIARSMAEVETRARLMERSESRLRAIDAALDRLESGDYGVCGNCGDDIPLARLMVVPFADYCVDCQNAKNNATRLGRASVGGFSRFASKEAASPVEVDADDHGLPPDDDISVHDNSAFGPEEGELEPEQAPRKRGRPRKRPV